MFQTLYVKLAFARRQTIIRKTLYRWPSVGSELIIVR